MQHCLLRILKLVSYFEMYNKFKYRYLAKFIEQIVENHILHAASSNSKLIRADCGFDASYITKLY